MSLHKVSLIAIWHMQSQSHTSVLCRTSTEFSDGLKEHETYSGFWWFTVVVWLCTRCSGCSRCHLSTLYNNINNYCYSNLQTQTNDVKFSNQALYLFFLPSNTSFTQFTCMAAVKEETETLKIIGQCLHSCSVVAWYIDRTLLTSCLEY